MPLQINAALRGAITARPRRWACIAWAVAMVPTVIARAQSDLDIIGLTKLRALDPTLTGSGVTVGQAEANNGSSIYEFQVNPTTVGQPAGLFTYTDQFGTTTTTFNPAAESTHADSVANIFYGATGSGVAPGVAHVDNYSADDYFNSIIFWGTATPDTIVNQSFDFSTSSNPVTALADQESSDTSYDNYIAQNGTIIVTAVGNASTGPLAPATSYNGIAVGVDNGSSASGPTLDDGRDKPDITAPGVYTSFSTPLVSGSATILVQAGRRGDGGKTPQIEADAVDPRTIKALLLNGADKQAVPFSRTPSSPLDPTDGAGLLNVYNSYEQLAAGFFQPSSINNSLSLLGTPPPDVTSPAINSPAGWSFQTLTSSLLTSASANYIFQPPKGVTNYTLTATLVWERQFNTNPEIPLGINNLDLYLFDTTTNKLIDYSNSTVDNVQDVYDLNLTPGDRYDLEVLKNGGIPALTPGVVSNSETYALAFNFAAIQSTWNLSGGGSAALAANWAGGLPNSIADTANFAGAIQTASTVTFPANWEVGNILFNNTHSYTIAPAAGSGPLILDNGGPTAIATINDSGGSHTIATALQLNSALAVSIANPGDNITITGAITDNPATSGASLTINAIGTLTLAGANSYRSGTIVDSGQLTIAAPRALPPGEMVVNKSTLSIQTGASISPVIAGVISGTGRLIVGASSPAYLRLAPGDGMNWQSSLTIAPGSSLDITNDALTLSYPSPFADPVSSIVSALSTAYHGPAGAWTGPGLTSSLAAQNPNELAVGYADGNTDKQSHAAPNQVIVKYTLAGDAFLEGSVGFDDLVVIAQNFGLTGQDWAQGNFTYDPNGSVGFADLVLLAQNYGQTLAQVEGQTQTLQLSPAAQSASAVAQTPEPGIATLAASAAGLLARRRRPRRSTISP